MVFPLAIGALRVSLALVDTAMLIVQAALAFIALAVAYASPSDANKLRMQQMEYDEVDDVDHELANAFSPQTVSELC